ncbi:MAG: DsbA family protein [Rhodospirillales bacterium]
MDREIIFVVDPMCSWCWGFSPVIEAIRSAYGERAAMTIVAGGLRPLTSAPMSDKDKAEIRHHWEAVEKASGQPFDFDFFERSGFVYDTEPACRALVTVRTLEPASSYTYLARLHRAFYAENRDVTADAVLAALAEETGVERERFVEAFRSREMIYQTSGDFIRSQSMGARGFPTVVLRNGEDYALLVAGFVPFDKLKAPLEGWFAGEAAAADNAAGADAEPGS